MKFSGLHRIFKVSMLLAIAVFCITTILSYFVALIYHDGEGGGLRLVEGVITLVDPLGAGNTHWRSDSAMVPLHEACDIRELRNLHYFDDRGWKISLLSQWDANSEVPSALIGRVPRYAGPKGWKMQPCALAEALLGRTHILGQGCQAWRRCGAIFSINKLLVVLVLIAMLAWKSEIKRFYAYLYRSHKTSCANCAYCLTGNVSGICPECGTAIPAEQMKRIRKADAAMKSNRVVGDPHAPDESS